MKFCKFHTFSRVKEEQNKEIDLINEHNFCISLYVTVTKIYVSRGDPQVHIEKLQVGVREFRDSNPGWWQWHGMPN